MERLSVLCLSLLLCSLSGAELQDNEIIEQREVRPESVNVPEPQPCPSDLHAVLREMSVKLAVLQTEMKQLQEQNAKYEVKMEQLQTLNQEQNAKLAKYEVKMEQMQTHDQEQAAKLKDLEQQSSHMDSQQQAQTSALHRVQAWCNVTETQVQTLTRDRAVGQVAFSASLLASGYGNTGPFNTHTTLVFRGVVSNIGNAYNPNTGFFTALVRGAYHFEFYIFAQGGSDGSTRVGLVNNGEHVFNAQEVQSTGWGAASNGATLLLEAGDVVFLRLWANYKIYDDSDHYSTFSGHLLFPM